MARLIICALLSASLPAFGADKPAVAGNTAAAAATEGKSTDGSLTLKEKIFSPEYAGTTLATVNGETITMGELAEAVSSLHEGMGEGKKAAKQDFGQLLDRLVNSALIIQEARNIGLEEQPEVKDVVDTFAKRLMREKLMAQQVKDVKADPKEVAKVYQERNSEWKIKSLVFKTENDAKKAVKEVKAGKKYDALYAKALKSGKAEKGKDETYIKMENMPPEIVKIIAGMKKGSCSPVVPLQNGFLIFRLDDTRHIEDANVKEQVDKELNTKARLAALEKFRDELVKKHVKQNTELVDKLDFEAKEPGFEAMLTDKRAIAEIGGEEPVTVADLAEAIKAKFYHGVDIAASDKKVNKNKKLLLDDILANRAMLKEAKVRNVEQGEDYRKKLKDFTASILFGAFIEKVVQPEIKLTTEELQAYYKEHIAQYTYPEMYRIEAIVFSSNRDAEAAIDKLRKGMDFKWFKTNAEGRLPEGTQPKMDFGSGLVMKSQMPESVQKTLTGVKSGEYRQYAIDDEYYVLNVIEVVPAKEQPFNEVEAPIRKNVYYEKLNKSVESWAAKLREASDIKINDDFKRKDNA